MSEGAAGVTKGVSRHSTTVRRGEVPAMAAPCRKNRTRREFLVTSLMIVPGKFTSCVV